MTRPQANLLLLLAGAIWGMGFVAQQTAMDDVGPFVFIGVRFLVATLVVLPFALRESRQIHQRGNNPLRMRDWQHFAVIGIVLFAAIGLQQVGLLTTTVTNSGFLTGLYVVFTPFIAILLFREWPHAVVWPAALCAFSGIFLLSGGKFNGHSIGDLLTVGCAVFTALQVVLIARHVTESARPLALSVVQFSVTAGIAFVVALIYEPIVWSAIKAAGNEILYTGVMSSGVAFTLQAIAQRYTPTAQAAIFMSSEALFAALFGAVLLGERIGLSGLFGCALIFSAMLAVEFVPMLQSRARKSNPGH